MAGTWILALVLAAFPPCAGASTRATQLHRAINLERVGAGLLPLAGQPVLCQVAAERAREVAASGSPEMDLRTLDATRREVYRRGYRPQSWAQSALVLNPGDAPLTAWREVKPEAFAESIHGDFEHLAIGVAAHDGRPVYSIVLGLSVRTFDWRRAAPLADTAGVRAAMLERVNAIRAEHGRPPVVADTHLDRAAARHARDLLVNDYYAHRSLDGRSVRDRAVAAGFSARPGISENLARGLFTPIEAVDRWMNSSGHRRNILDRSFRRVGHGIAVGETERGVEAIWVQVLAGAG